MARRCEQLPLFAWADSRPSAVVIDATQKFHSREIAFLRQLMIGYVPRTNGGAAPIDLAAYRASVGARQKTTKRRGRKDAA